MDSRHRQVGVWTDRCCPGRSQFTSKTFPETSWSRARLWTFARISSWPVSKRCVAVGRFCRLLLPFLFFPLDCGTNYKLGRTLKWGRRGWGRVILDAIIHDLLTWCTLFLLFFTRRITCVMDRQKKSWTCLNRTRHSSGMDYLQVWKTTILSCQTGIYYIWKVHPDTMPVLQRFLTQQITFLFLPW